MRVIILVVFSAVCPVHMLGYQNRETETMCNTNLDEDKLHSLNIGDEETDFDMCHKQSEDSGPAQFESSEDGLWTAYEKNTAESVHQDSEGMEGINTADNSDMHTIEKTCVHYNGNNRLKDREPEIMENSDNHILDNQSMNHRKEDMDSVLLSGHKNNENTKQKEKITLLYDRYFRCAPPISRLGNMMFQLSATIGIAHALRYKPFIEPRHPLTHFFDTGIVKDMHVTREMVLSEEQCINQVWSHDKRWLNYNLTTWGYLQSWKYFQNATEEVRQALTIWPMFKHEARRFLFYNTREDDIRIGMHVRRGDFTVQGTADLGFAIADKGYIENAMNWYRTRYGRVIFVVVSDDIPWCRENIREADVVFSHYTEAIIDIAILSLCNHSIITGGSFGWWGAWLAGGDVVYFKGYPRPGSWLDTQIQDYYFEHWIGFDNGSK